VYSKKLKILIVRISLVFFLFIGFVVQAQDQREFDQEAMEEYLESRDFAYMSLHPKPVSIWERIWNWIQNLFYALWYNTSTSTWIGVIVILVGLGIGVYWLTKMRYKSAITSNSENQSFTRTEVEVESIDFDALIEDALNQKDFRLAIRNLYLKSLKTLSAGGLITFREYKTPYDYQFELSDHTADTYGKLALLFEYSWYGDFDVKRSDFDKGLNFYQKLEEEVE